MRNLKIIVTGSINSGKREFIRAITEIDVVSLINAPYNTYLKIREEEQQERERRGGRITISDDLSLTLHRVASNALSISSLPRGMNGYLVLIDSTDPRSFYEGRALLLYMAHFPRVPYIVVANKQDLEKAMPIEQIRQKMRMPDTVPLLGCTTKERDSVRNVVIELLYLILPVET